MLILLHPAAGAAAAQRLLLLLLILLHPLLLLLRVPLLPHPRQHDQLLLRFLEMCLGHGILSSIDGHLQLATSS